jgi:hypothetical protein
VVTNPRDVERPDLLRHAKEKFGAAVQVLATHPGDVKARLLAAAEHLAMVRPTGLPSELRSEFESLWSALTARTTDEASAVRATLHRMRFSTAAALAERLYSLSCQVDALCHERQDREVRPTDCP